MSEEKKEDMISKKVCAKEVLTHFAEFKKVLFLMFGLQLGYLLTDLPAMAILAAIPMVIVYKIRQQEKYLINKYFKGE